MTTDAGGHSPGEIHAAAGGAKCEVPARAQGAQGSKDGGPEGHSTQSGPNASMADKAEDPARFHAPAASVDVHVDYGSTSEPFEERLRIHFERWRGVLKPRPRDSVPGPTRAVTLARKINLLLDTNAAETGKVMTFAAIEESVQKAGYPITRTRWSLLKSGKEQVVPDETLCGLAAVFGVDAGYLLQDHGPPPERVELRMSRLRSLRRARVRDVAVRALACVDPRTLAAILGVLDDPEVFPAPTWPRKG